MSSHSILSSCLLPIMKDVSEALKFDRQEKNEDAYRKYLECVMRVATGLLKALHSDDGHVFVTKDVDKMVKLGQQCMDRVANIVNGRLKKAPKSSIQTPSSLSLNTNPMSRSQMSPSTPMTRETASVPHSQVTSPGLPSRLSGVSDPSELSATQKVVSSDTLSSSTIRKLGPMELATRQNQQLLVALRKRQAQAKNRSASANLSLTLQRKMAENLAIAKAQEEALAKKVKERQERLEEQAARRFHTPVGLSQEEQQQRQVYKRVLEFEQENLWMMELRRKFEDSPSNIDVISELITAVLSCDAHPLSEELQQHQRTLLDKVTHLVEGKLDTVENITVPLPKHILDQSNLKDFKSSVQKSKSDMILSESVSSIHTFEEDDSTYGSLGRSHVTIDGSSVTQEEIESTDRSKDIYIDTDNVEVKPGGRIASIEDRLSAKDDITKDVADISSEIKADIEQSIVEGNRLKSRLEKENKSLKSLSRHTTEEYEKYNQENMDDLFENDSDVDDDADDDDNDSIASYKEQNGICDGQIDKIISEPGEQAKEPETPKVSKKNASFEKLENRISLLRNDAYHRHLKGITDDILTSIERVQVLFVIVFEQLDSAEGRDQCNVLLEGYFFKPLWRYLLVLFRLANEPKEIALADIMTKNQSSPPKMFAVRDQLCLDSDLESSDYPYKSVVSELVGLTQCQTMFEKLDCLVRASKEVMQCVEQYYKQRVCETPCLGADDLIPLLCYIVIRSGLPQLVSECQAMEKFIHEGYMFGEEGYCLTSFQTAIDFLISQAVAVQEV